MSRVTPLQLPLISYSAEGRYQPIRPIGDPTASASSSSIQRKTNGPTAAFGGTTGGEKVVTAVSSGSIIMLRATESMEGGEAEYIELDRSLWPDEEEVRAETQGEAQQEFIAPAPADPAMREEFEDEG